MEPAMTSHTQRDDEIRELGELIGEIRVAMLTTVADNGMLVSRPMHSREREFDGELWFFVAVDSDKVDELLHTPQVNVAFADPNSHHYASIAGEARISRDRALIGQLWNERYDRLWFKGGQDDPNLALLQVQAQTAEVWNAGDSALGRAFNFVRARLSGDGTKIGEHHHVDLPRH
jgi:general stress protein 26